MILGHSRHFFDFSIFGWPVGAPGSWQNSGFWPFLGPFLAKIVKIAYLGYLEGQFFGRKMAQNRAISVGKSNFWTF